MKKEKRKDERWKGKKGGEDKKKEREKNKDLKPGLLEEEDLNNNKKL